MVYVCIYKSTDMSYTLPFKSLQYSTVQNTLKLEILWNIITIEMKYFLFEFILKLNIFLWCNAEFLICWFAAQETFLIIINVENSCAA